MSANGTGGITVIGVDTGDTAGLVKASWNRGTRIPVAAQAYQCDRKSAVDMLRYLLRGPGVTAVQLEAFDDRPRGNGLKGTSPSAIRQQVHDLEVVCAEAGVPCFVVQASEMKKWATDDRLRATKVLWEITNGMPRHARDGGRHALMCAMRHCGLPDPLSRRTEKTGAG